MNGQAPPRLGILVSGRGSNLQRFINTCADGQLEAQIALVISNNPDAMGLQRAARAGLEAVCINHRDFDSREAFDQALLDALQAHKVDIVILAGFMRILTPVLIAPYLGRLLNIHPSLLPKYPGLHTHQRALDAGDCEAGVTVHFVTQELDGGPPVLQARVPIKPGDSADTLADRVSVMEHIIYPLATKWLLEKRLTLAETGASLDGHPLPATGIPYREGLD